VATDSSTAVSYGCRCYGPRLPSPPESRPSHGPVCASETGNLSHSMASWHLNTQHLILKIECSVCQARGYHLAPSYQRHSPVSGAQRVATEGNYGRAAADAIRSCNGLLDCGLYKQAGVSIQLRQAVSHFVHVVACMGMAGIMGMLSIHDDPTQLTSIS